VEVVEVVEEVVVVVTLAVGVVFYSEVSETPSVMTSS